jgi:hypothetical protein
MYDVRYTMYDVRVRAERLRSPQVGEIHCVSSYEVYELYELYGLPQRVISGVDGGWWMSVDYLSCIRSTSRPSQP